MSGGEGETMTPARLEAFSDGVIAIIITIMVLELKIPHSPEPAALLEQWPLFGSYALSYVMVGIYWVNHHYLFKAVRHVTHGILWANLLLLLFLSLVPFATGYVGENHLAPFPMALYAVVMLMPALCYYVLHTAIIRAGGHESAAAQRSSRKGLIALALYAVAIPAAYLHPGVTIALIVVVAVMYLVPTQYL
jgi:uncharacterized membrane protein